MNGAGRRTKPRFGAVGKHGSIAVIERFIRTMKSEGTRQILVLLNLHDMRRELALFIYWYNEFRPHQYLNARTPQEVYSHSPPRPRIQVERNAELPEISLEISYFEEEAPACYRAQASGLIIRAGQRFRIEWH